jgi:hypothetical protein
MRLPNKITTFNESVLPKFPHILRIVESGNVSVIELYNSVKSITDDVENFLEVLDCLYALGKIDFNEEERTICYVGNVG